MSTNLYQRQKVRAGLVTLGPANAGTGNGKTAKLPVGAHLLRMGYQTETAFDGSGTVTGTVSDGTTTFVNAVDVKTTGNETVANVPKFYPAGGTLTFTLADQNDDSEEGQVVAFYEYLELAAHDENYG
jgi:hypothetical protein